MDECGSQNGNMLWGRIQCILTYGGGSKSILDILINYTLLIVNVVAIGLWMYYMQHNHHDNEDDDNEDDDDNNNNNVPTTTTNDNNNNNNVAMAAQDPSHRLLSSLSQSSRLDQTASAFTAATTSLVFVTAFQIGLCLAVKCSGISIIWCACIGWYVHKKSKLVTTTTITTTRQQQGSTTRPGHLQQQQRQEQQQQQRGQQPEHTPEGRTPSQDVGTTQPLTNSSCSSPPQYNNNINNNNNKHDDEDDDENNTTPVLHHDSNDDNNNRTRLVSTNQYYYYYSVHGVLEMGLGILNLGVLFYYAWTLEPITTIAHVCAVFLGMVLSMIEPWYYCCGSG